MRSDLVAVRGYDDATSSPAPGHAVASSTGTGAGNAGAPFSSSPVGRHKGLPAGEALDVHHEGLQESINASRLQGLHQCVAIRR